MKEPTKRVLTEAEAAEYLNTSPRTLQKWRQIGGGPRYSKTGRLVRYRQAVLDDYLDAGERANTSERV